MPTLAASDPQQEQQLALVLVQLAVILVTARIFAAAFRRLRQPAVVGEIAAGLVLGPSLLGRLLPEVSQAVFDPAAQDVFGVLSHLGLVLLLFLVGLEFDFHHLRWHGRTCLTISLAGMILPFLLGMAIAPVLHPHLETDVPLVGFMLFMGIALSITAIPVLGRIMLELGITRTRLATITIVAAALEDAVGWIALAAVASFIQARFDVWQSLRMLGLAILFFGAMMYVVRPLFCAYLRRAHAPSSVQRPLSTLAVTLALVFLAGIATSKIGIFAIFGAFLFGTILSDQTEFRDAILAQLRSFVTVFFMPIFFTYTGLRTDIGTLDSTPHLLLFGLVLIAAVSGKVIGCGAAAWWGGFSLRESLCVGALMNTRGLMELIVVNVGRELGVIPPSVYCMLVLMALITTLLTTPAVLAAATGTELEASVRESGFA